MTSGGSNFNDFFLRINLPKFVQLNSIKDLGFFRGGKYVKKSVRTAVEC